MAISILFNSKVILLVLFALCALLLTNTQATSSLSELNCQCENKFWFKNLKDFKKSVKSKCLKEKSHNYEKRHRQHNVCKNDSHGKKLLLSKWEKFSDCRCGSALVELSDFKVSKIFTCYQVASLNKATGEFVGELTVFRKKSEHNYDLAIRFPKNVKIYGQKGKYKNDFYRLKKDNHPSHTGQFLIEKILINGRIPKHVSMNRINIEKISPDEFILLLDKGRVRSLKENCEFVIIPLSKFLPSENFLTKKYKYEENEHKDKDKDKDKDEHKKKKPSDKPNSPPAEPSAEPPANGSGSGYGDGSGSPDGSGDGSGYGSGDGSGDGSGGYGSGYGSGGGSGSPAVTGPQDDTGSGAEPQDDSNNGDTTPSGTTPSGSQEVTGPQDSTESTPSNAASAGQESTNNVKPSGGISSAAIGSIVFGCIIAVGAAFVGYNTYERIRWRRQYRRRQEAAQQNTSLANVPDYNGYGRAY